MGSGWETLSQEVKDLIWNYLEVPDLLSTSFVSRAWREQTLFFFQEMYNYIDQLRLLDRISRTAGLTCCSIARKVVLSRGPTEAHMPPADIRLQFYREFLRVATVQLLNASLLAGTTYFLPENGTVREGLVRFSADGRNLLSVVLREAETCHVYELGGDIPTHIWELDPRSNFPKQCLNGFEIVQTGFSGPGSVQSFALLCRYILGHTALDMVAFYTLVLYDLTRDLRGSCKSSPVLIPFGPAPTGHQIPHGPIAINIRPTKSVVIVAWQNLTGKSAFWFRCEGSGARRFSELREDFTVSSVNLANRASVLTISRLAYDTTGCLFRYGGGGRSSCVSESDEVAEPGTYLNTTNEIDVWSNICEAMVGMVVMDSFLEVDMLQYFALTTYPLLNRLEYRKEPDSWRISDNQPFECAKAQLALAIMDSEGPPAFTTTSSALFLVVGLHYNEGLEGNPCPSEHKSAKLRKRVDSWGTVAHLGLSEDLPTSSQSFWETLNLQLCPKDHHIAHSIQGRLARTALAWRHRILIWSYDHLVLVVTHETIRIRNNAIPLDEAVKFTRRPTLRSSEVACGSNERITGLQWTGPNTLYASLSNGRIRRWQFGTKDHGGTLRTVALPVSIREPDEIEESALPTRLPSELETDKMS